MPGVDDHQELLRRIAARVTRSAGIHLPADRMWRLDRPLSQRRRACGCSSARSYLSLLEGPSGEEELEQLVEALRIGETRFFRHTAHVRALKRVALPELHAAKVAAGSSHIRIWSAGCATGEEPYTLAMVLSDWLEDHTGWTYALLATDLSREALDRGRRGLFPIAAVTSIPPASLERHMTRTDDGYRVDRALQRSITFEQHNLITDRYPAGFDLIFCRNVMIYFDRKARDRVAEKLSGSLAIQGYMFLGPSESLASPGDPFTALRTPDGVIYQRTGAEKLHLQRPEHAPHREHDPDRSTARAARARREGPPGHGGQGLSAQQTGAAAADSEVAVVRLTGHYGPEDGRLAQEVRPALEQPPARVVILDLDRATYIDQDCARVIHRLTASLAADHRRLVLVASRPGAARWVTRQRLLDSVTRRSSLQEALTLRAEEIP